MESTRITWASNPPDVFRICASCQSLAMVSVVEPQYQKERVARGVPDGIVTVWLTDVSPAGSGVVVAPSSIEYLPPCARVVDGCGAKPEGPAAVQGSGVPCSKPPLLTAWPLNPFSTLTETSSRYM